MAGVREQKKEKTRKDIIRSASELFYKNGYEQTSLEQIAGKAFLGVGTLYNYFSGKADLFLAVISETVSHSDLDSGSSDNCVRKGHADLAIDYIESKARKFIGISRALWREVLAAVFNPGAGENSLMTGLLFLDKNLIGQIESCLIEEKRLQLIPEDQDTFLTARVLYGAILSQFLFYIYDESISPETLITEMKQSIRLILGKK